MSSIQNVAVAGASGAMGAPLVQELLKAKFNVTALTRPDSSNHPPTGAKTVEVNYDDAESLKNALKDQHALISTLGTASIEQQHKLFEAAIDAGVKRLIPSEFGCDTLRSPARDLPVFAPKVQIREAIEQKIKGTGTTYTWVFNNVFLDWSLDNKFVVNLQDKKFEIYDGGEKVYTTTPIPFIARGVVGVLKNPEATANRAVRIHGAALTQKQFLDIVQQVVGKDGWQIDELKTKDLEKESYGILQNDPGNFMGWVPGFLKRAIFAEGYGGSFAESNDNELLGLKAMSEKDVEELVRSKA